MWLSRAHCGPFCLLLTDAVKVSHQMSFGELHVDTVENRWEQKLDRCSGSKGGGWLSEGKIIHILERPQATTGISELSFSTLPVAPTSNNSTECERVRRRE